MADEFEYTESEESDVLSDLISGAFAANKASNNEADQFEESFAMPFDAPLVGGGEDSDLEEDDGVMNYEGTQFTTPIFFEDGMDYIECQLYYGLLDSQHKGGVLRRLRLERHRPDGALMTPILRSCLRRPKRGSPRESDDFPVGGPPRKPMRRCSFTGTPVTHTEDSFDGAVSLSHLLLSTDDLQLNLPNSRPRVGFFEFAQVLTVPTRADLFHLRSELWMSRLEMQTSMRNAAANGGGNAEFWMNEADEDEREHEQDNEQDEDEDDMLKYVRASPAVNYVSKTQQQSKSAMERQCAYESAIAEYYLSTAGGANNSTAPGRQTFAQ